LYGLLTLGTMFTVEAAVALVTAGLAKHLLGLEASPVTISAGVIALSVTLLALGRYHWLDRITKGVVAVLTICTLIATALALGKLDGLELSLWPTLGSLEAEDYFFIAALVGWMPSAIDVSVWQSLWTLARSRDTGHRPSLRDSSFDFHVGYVATGVLALCFLTLGAAVMQGQELAPQPAAFAAQVVELYAATLGAWSRPIIALAAFLVMFSTTLTVVDGFPRALVVLLARFDGPEPEAGAAGQGEADTSRRAYWGGLLLLGAGSVIVLDLALAPGEGGGPPPFKAMIDLATILSFLTAPILSWLNHRAVLGPEVPARSRPRPWLRWASLGGILAQAALALYYVWLRFLS
ncbi:MAG: hypothetical protein OEY14_17015, partial [Myxococcales bacterium]|nr:hypothetical protein [Myxococcales bacterium]